MSFSLILTNCLFCGFASLLLLPLLRRPNILTFKKGIPIFIAVILVSAKMLIPYEFSFTHTLASKNVLPVIKAIGNFHLLKNITIGNTLMYIWILIAALLLLIVTYRHWKLMRILSIVPETKNEEIIQTMSELSIQKQIKDMPKVIHLDIDTGPFIVGLRNPVIVLPHVQLSEYEAKFILLHELEHLKHRHMLIKTCIEIVTAIYWWNPIVWLLRKEVICALEMQADTQVMQGLSNKASLSYLEALIQLSKTKEQKQNSVLTLSFAMKNSMVEYRIRTALKFNYFHEDTKTSIFHLWPLLLSIALLLGSFIYTFESYKIYPMAVEGTFTVNPKTDYFVLREDRFYDLYINEEYVVTIPSIPEDLSILSVHR